MVATLTSDNESRKMTASPFIIPTLTSDGHPLNNESVVK